MTDATKAADTATEIRTVRTVLQARPTLEGAGVHLRRVFGFAEVPMFDPFLMLDDFRSDEPAEFLAGFPWHPHRGIETITYVLCGDVEHGDSMGNTGVIGSGDVQWMTAGGGIIHQEMPKGDATGRMHGFQLWANLPASHKLMEPRYRSLSCHDIPEVITSDGATVRVIAGEVCGVPGPVEDIVIEPEYLDVTIRPGVTFGHATEPGHTVLAYVIEGAVEFPSADGHALAVTEGHAALFTDGAEITATACDRPGRFLLLSGKPLGEPVAWQGPIVMNTEEEVRTAFREYAEGTFVKPAAAA